MKTNTRPCAAKVYAKHDGQTRTNRLMTGTFHGFFQNIDGDEAYPVIVFESETGQVYTVNAEDVRFLDVLNKARSDEDENIANANLVAAAPDLLAALEGLNYYGDAEVFCCCPRKDGVAENKHHSTACNAVRAAIKKARGE